MDLLHTDISLSEHDHGGQIHQMPPACYPLIIPASGIDSFVLESQGDVEFENQEPDLSLLSFSSQHHVSYPVPGVKVGSNDLLDRFSRSGAGEIESRRHRLQHQKPLNTIVNTANRIRRPSKPISDPSRAYLLHPKYIEYRSRPRQEIGKDGKPIWPDHIEAAFQNGFMPSAALAHIAPMGKRKCSQRGRLFGRNMLIAEWIFRETGEERARKQVSSHIQVLDKFLVGTPEWDRLIRSDEKETGTGEGHKFYHNSIEHLVDEQRRMKINESQGSNSEESDNEWGNDPFSQSSEQYTLHHLDFYMRVSLAQNWDNALHNYTRLQSANRNSLPIPLEDIDGWRFSFPRLQDIVDEWPARGRPEIVLLNATFQLMDDFPPRHSKLGIDLELDFNLNNKEGLGAPHSPANLSDWGCIMHLYRDGQEIQDGTYEACRLAEDGKIKPFFQSKWWASTFTSLTESIKLASESKNAHSIELATSQVQSFFRSLSIMQEIWAVQTSKLDQSRSKIRVAILLWKFDQAPAGFVGTTTWHTLIPPPARLLTNSPFPPGSEIELPPLAMDSMIEDSPNQRFFDRNSHFLGQPNLSYELCPDTGDHGVCNNGLLAFKPEQLASYSQFDHAQARFLPSQLDQDNERYAMDDVSGQLDMNITGQHKEASLDDVQNFLQPESTQMTKACEDDIHQVDPNDHTYDSQDPPLMRFDMKCHQALQEQLGADSHTQHVQHHAIQPSEPLSHPGHETGSPVIKTEEHFDPKPNLAQWTGLDDHDEVLRSALLALGDLAEDPQSDPSAAPATPDNVQGQFCVGHMSPKWDSPLTIRPGLVTHHSFPGCAASDRRDEEHMGFELLAPSHPTNDQYCVGQTSSQVDSDTSDMRHQRSDDCATDYLRAKSEPDNGLYLHFDQSLGPKKSYDDPPLAIASLDQSTSAPARHDWVHAEDPLAKDSHDGLQNQSTSAFSQNAAQTIFSQDGEIKIDVGNRFMDAEMEDVFS